MKKKAQASSVAIPASALTNRWFDYLFPLVPFLALVPNFFMIPSLSYAGLATQELVYAVAVLLCSLLGLLQAWKYPKTETYTKQAVWMFAPLLLFMVWQTLSLTWSSDRGETLRQLGMWFGFCVFSLTAWFNLRTRTTRWLFYSLFGLAAILALSLAYEYRTWGPADMQGIFFNHGITSELLATLWPLFACVFLFEKEDRLAVVLSALAVAFTTGAVMLTIRRGALLGIVVASVLILVAWISGQIKLAHRLRMVTVVFAFMLFVLPVIIVKRDALLSRLQGATTLREASVTESVDLGLTSRAITWLTALEMGKHHWLKGVGLGAYPSRYGFYRRFFVENPRYQGIAAVAETEDYDQIRSPLAHSEYLQLFAELGLVGVVLYLLFWSQVLLRLWQMRHARLGYLAFAAFVCTISLAISSSMSSFGFRQTPSILVLINVIALGWAVRDRKEEQTDQEFQLRPGARLGVCLFFVLISLLVVLRNYNVYASQRTQGSLTVEGQVDFTFALDNPSVNEASVRRYQRILDYDPQNAGAHLGLGMLLFQMKRLPECIQHADRAFALSYNRPFTWLLRAFANEHNGAPDKAQEILRDGLKSFPKSFILRAALAELLRKRGQREEAQQHMAELEKRDQTLARSWALLLRYKDEEATRLAKEQGLTPPGELKPQLARVLAQARAYHYLRGAAPTASPTPTAP